MDMELWGWMLFGSAYLFAYSTGWMMGVRAARRMHESAAPHLGCDDEWMR